MQIYEKSINVSHSDLDELNHVNNVRYVQWVNDIAKFHWTKKATNEMLENYFWVLLNHNIEYKSSALLNDVVRLKTYVSQSEGVKSTRVVEMRMAKTNLLLARSETIWCLMDMVTKRPTRIPESIINL